MKINWHTGEPTKEGSYITVQEYVDNFERHRFISCAYWMNLTVENDSGDDGGVIIHEVGYWQTKERTSYIIAWVPINEIGIEIPKGKIE